MYEVILIWLDINGNRLNSIKSDVIITNNIKSRKYGSYHEQLAYFRLFFLRNCPKLHLALIVTFDHI
jgi:hypothetical protein